MLIEKTLEAYLKEVESDSPAPGGGSVSAYAGALGAALTNMVWNLTFTKKAFSELEEDEKELMKKNSEEISKIQHDLQKIVDEDSSAFEDVIKALKMPKETEKEKEERSLKIQEGYKKALVIPFKCAELALKAMNLQKPFADNGNINAITDVGVGTLLLYSAVEGALFNVTINLKALKDEEYKASTAEKVKDILSQASELKEKTLKKVYERLQ